MAAQKQAARKPRRRDRKSVPVGQAHIKSTFNNTIISITDRPAQLCPGRPVAMSVSRAPVSPRRTPLVWPLNPQPQGYGARSEEGRRVREGPGSGRETAIRSLQSAGLEVGSITDVTPQAHNGVRPPKRRRV